MSATNDLNPEQAPTSSAETFPIPVPDFVLVDTAKVNLEFGRAKTRGRPRVDLGISWLIHLAVITQRSSFVILPDAVIGACLWGPRRYWPKQRVRKRIDLYMDRDPSDPLEKPCPPQCPLFNKIGIPHRHHEAFIEPDFLGALDFFRLPSDGGEPIYKYDFRKPTRPRATEQDEFSLEAEKQRWNEYQQLKRQFKIRSAYFPLLLFGYSPRLKLTGSQCNLMRAFVQELTRDGASLRMDKAAIIPGGPEGLAGERRLGCPFLAPGERYVAFNANGKRTRRGLAGRGYRLFGEWGWLTRAGYRSGGEEDPEENQAALRAFVKDLSYLAQEFGLTCAAWHPKAGDWRRIKDLPRMARSKKGQRWLSRCLLRLYAPEDYLTRWRSYIAARLGFSSIPSEDTPMLPSKESNDTFTLQDLDAWMQRQGLVDRDVAKIVGCSRSFVSAVRRGDKPIPEAMRAKLQRASATEIEVPKPAINYGTGNLKPAI